MRQTIQGDLGSVTLIPPGEEDFSDDIHAFIDEYDAAEYLRSQFLADPNDMTILRSVLDETEQMMMFGLTDDEVITRVASHLAFGSLYLVDDGAAGFFDGSGGGGSSSAADDKKEAADKAATEAATEAAAAAKKEKKKILIDVVIQLKYWNPVARKDKAFPAGVTVKLMNGSSVIETKTTDAKGICAYSEREYTSEKPSLVADFSGKEYIDLDKNELVSAGTVSPGDKRRLLRMPSKWDSTKEKKFVDKRGGRFSTGKLTSVSKGQQGSKGSPWKIQVDHAWEKLWAAFVFYNPLAKKTEGVCYGGLLEVFSDSGLSSQVAGGTVIDKKKGLCYIGVWKETDREKLHMRLRYGANAYLDLKKKAARRKILTVSRATLNGYSGVKRRRHYPLPAEWRSKKQYAIRGNSCLKYEVQIKKGISKSSPLTFNLDDFVLVDAAGAPIAWDSLNSFTVFNSLMRIRDPLEFEPYFTDRLLSYNHFDAKDFYYKAGKGSTEITRVVAVKRGFHDLLHKRTTQGDIIGARAAVKDDHPKEDELRPLVTVAGNYTVHYFHDCAVYKGKPLSHLLAYWSVLFKASTTQPSTNVGVSELDAYKKATLKVKIRHEGQHPAAPSRSRSKHKNYSLVPTRGAKRIIKVCVHIEAREAAPVHTVINVHNDRRGSRDNMGPTSANFSKSNYQHSAGNRSMDKADKLTFTRYTYAHETGHALGLHDEYIEPIANPANGNGVWQFPSLAKYNQHYDGMPYSCEEGISMMESNKALRLRHYWQYCRFINENATVQRQLGNVRYQVEYPIRGGPTLRYNLANRYKHIYKAVESESPLTRGQGKMDLLLYKCGQDEMQRYNLKAGFSGIDSILVVRQYFHFSWPNNHLNNSFNTWAKRVAVVTEFQKAVSRNNGENNAPLYTLESSSGDFRCCLIYFRPHYSLAAAGAPGDTQFKLKVRPRCPGAANNIQDVYKEAHTGDTIAVTNRVNWTVVLRYMLGLDPVKVSGTGASKKITPITTIKADDLDFLATWTKNKLTTRGGNFKVKKH